MQSETIFRLRMKQVNQTMSKNESIFRELEKLPHYNIWGMMHLPTQSQSPVGLKFETWKCRLLKVLQLLPLARATVGRLTGIGVYSYR